MLHLRAVCAVLASLAITAGLLAGLSGGSAAAGVEAVQAPRLEKRGPGFQQPKEGKCYRLTRKQAFKRSSTKRAVGCNKRHNARTLRVLRLPRNVSWSNQSRIQDITAKRCIPEFDKALGAGVKTIQQTAYIRNVLQPTKKQRNRGARWVRCDIILLSKSGLRNLPRDLRIPRGPLDDEIRACFGDRFRFVYSCKNAHKWSASKSVKLPKGPYPSRQKFSRVANRKCASEGPGWSALLASRERWKYGARVITCFERV